MRFAAAILFAMGLTVAIAEPPAKPKLRFTISKETTYIEKPLDADGRPDYIAALNEKLSQGVTPENNACVLLWQALGPKDMPAEMSTEFFRRLGMTAPPAEGKYFIGLTQYAKQNNLALEDEDANKGLLGQIEIADRRPWTPQQHPHLDAWLRANEQPLQIVVEATKRAHYYSPLVTAQGPDKPGGIVSILLPGVQKCREFAQALSIRAMLRLGGGQTEQAWQDLQAIHRLGRQVARGGTLIELLVGLACDFIAMGDDVTFLASAKLDARQLDACLRDLRALPPFPSVADIINTGDRFMLLDSTLLIERHGMNYLQALGNGRNQDPSWERFFGNMALAWIGWDAALKTSNIWFDRCVLALRIPGRAERTKALAEFDSELRRLRASTQDRMRSPNLVFAGNETRGEIFGGLLVTLMMPAFQKVQFAVDRRQQSFDNLLTAFAIERYQRDHGRYPVRLSDLLAKYAAREPLDLFANAPLKYQLADGGFALWSVGVNGKDDQGRSSDEDPQCDDLVIRVPLPKIRK